MLKQITLVFVTVTVATVAFAQQDGLYQIGYAANLNIGDSEVNITADGLFGGFYNNNTTLGGVGNTCANVYVFDPSEEMISCCSCLVTPNALVSLSAKNDLISDVLTPAIPTSIVIKLVGTEPGTSGTATAPVFNICNPTMVGATVGGVFSLSPGLLAWGTTLEPAATPGTYGPVNVPFINATAPLNAMGFLVFSNEVNNLITVCGFLQQEGTGYGVCKGCGLGALGGTKQ